MLNELGDNLTPAQTLYSSVNELKKIKEENARKTNEIYTNKICLPKKDKLTIGYGHTKNVKPGDKKGAAEEFDAYITQKGTALNGLVKRRKLEKELFLTPDEE